MKHIIALLFLCSLLNTALAFDTGWLQAPRQAEVQVRLEQAGNYNAEGNYYPLLLHFKLKEDWKTYWRSPGQGGTPPKLKLSNSENIANVIWHWPTPERFDVLGVETIGYQENVTFPLQLIPENATKPVTIDGVVSVAACMNYCTQIDFPVNQLLNQGDALIDAEGLFEKAMSTVPSHSEDITTSASTHTDTEEQEQLTVQVISKTPWGSPMVFVDDIGDVSFTLLNQTVKGERLSATFAIENGSGLAPAHTELNNKNIIATVSDVHRDLETHAIINDTSHNTSGSVPLWKILLYAFIGGFILNLMPCVLPVMGMKINSLITTTNNHRKPLLMSALGIMLSFWLLGGFMLIIRWSGHQLGWGIQFQQPGFIAFMFIVTTLFALNLLGLFEIRLPSKMSTWIATRPDKGSSSMGHLLQGMFATLLATPCSAPFLGTAVSVALASNSLLLMSVFTGLGFGMSLPWLILAAIPSLNRYMPKPGPWMVKMKWLFGFMMAATSLWLLSLLSIKLGIVMAACALLFSTLSVYFMGSHRPNARRIGMAVVAMSVLVIGALFIFSASKPAWAPSGNPELNWEPLNIERIADEVAAGNTVFVDITADWCITCKVNKATVLQANPVYQKLASGDVTLLRGDWTTANIVVDRYLSKYQQAGIPYNRVYGPSATNGIGLSVVLKSSDVLDAIKTAEGLPRNP